MSVNAAIAERFSQMSKLMDLLGEDSFKSSAHARAARTLEDFPNNLETIAKAPDAKKQLTQIEGVGQKIADKIIEFVTTGRINELDELRAKVPGGLLQLLDIPGCGPKTVALLWKQGGVQDLAGLKRIIADGTILNLPRMGAKSVEKMKESIALAEQGSQRLHLGVAMPIAERIVARMRKIKGVEQVTFAGSLRRGKESIGDIDILVSTTNASAAAEAFRAMPEVRQVIVAGDNKSSVRFAVNPDLGRWEMEGKEGQEHLEPTVQVDLRVIDASCWGAALMYFTGSKEHNVKLRERAQKRGLTLNEYGLFPEDDASNEKEPPQKRGIKPIAGRTEEDVFHALDLEWVPPEMREDRGEQFERAGSQGVVPTRGSKVAVKAKTVKGEPTVGQSVPQLIDLGDIRAELHAHTTASDGVMSILELATHAKKRGFHTIAVTDHSTSSVIANGLSPDRLRTHINAVRAANDQIEGITILAGSEVDILADGTLDYDDDLLAELDVVVASPHAALGQDSAIATKRLLKAITHPLVHILGHPTGRLINRRAGLSPEMSELIAAAKEHDTALEINAHWMRLDLRDAHVRMAVDAGCKIAIDCDVHHPEDFDNLRFGVATGRRGWLTAEACVNTWEAGRLHKWLER